MQDVPLIIILLAILARIVVRAAAVNVVIVGGSSGMGHALARSTLTVDDASKICLASRSVSKLERARQLLWDEFPRADIIIQQVDCCSEASVQAFCEGLEDDCWDALVVSAAGPALHGPILELDTNAVQEFVNSKFWGAYRCAKYMSCKLCDNGSVTFVSGVLGRRPGINCSPLAICNGALEALTRSLALEWGPRLRVNCLCPGFCDTERFDNHPNKERMLANTAASLPLQRVGQKSDMGHALYFLMTSTFTTGSVLDCEGGHLIRQYADASNDPMRKQ